MDRVTAPALVPETHFRNTHSSREKTFIFAREHWLIPTQTILLFAAIFILFIGAHIAFSLIIFRSVLLLIAGIATLSVVASGCFMKIIIDWYFHYYLVTDRKISEIAYVPLMEHRVNEILLDRVKCTEVDIKGEGLLHHILGIGSVVVTFDRPTHSESFTFCHVGNAEEIRSLLTVFENQVPAVETIWHRSSDRSKHFYITEQIFPRLSV